MRSAGVYSLFVIGMVGVTVGCPAPPNNWQTQYDRGFEAGFALDEWYWDGFYDSYDTLGFTPIYYDDSEIPYVESPAYEAGYWDGVWYAYNDGYFTSYRYAFVLGFSEGYDNAYWPDYLAFLAADRHREYLNGGWADGYHDGFSEGRVFGAYDYEAGWPFDWIDALLDYESGTDLYFEEVNVGTGIYGPVYLYEYGVNPATQKAAERVVRRLIVRTLRQATLAKDVDLSDRELFRTLTQALRQEWNIAPVHSSRTDRLLRLNTTWLQRVQTYAATWNAAPKHVRTLQP